MIGYLARRAATALKYQGTWRVCLAYRCGRIRIPTASRFCRLHTDAILRERFPECAARVEASGVHPEVLAAEIEAGRLLAFLRSRR